MSNRVRKKPNTCFTGYDVELLITRVLFPVALLLCVAMMIGSILTDRETQPIIKQQANSLSIQKQKLYVQEEQLEEQQRKIDWQEATIENYKRQVYQLQEQLRPLDQHGVRRDRMIEFYGERDSVEQPEFVLDADFRDYCREQQPEAVLPSNDWTVESVRDSWLSAPEIWGFYGGKDGDYQTYFTWTPDYEHCFILDMDEPFLYARIEEHEPLVSGWLVVDGVRVAMLDQQTYQIDDPWELVRQYQAGEWDGSIRRSPDGSTTVQLLYGRLDYDYEAYWYDEHFDPEGTAWQQFAKMPWWWENYLSADLAEALGLLDGWAPDPEVIVNQCCSASVFTKIYPDLPQGYDQSEVIEYEQRAGQLFCLKKSQIEVFEKGKLIEQWDLGEQGLAYSKQGSRLFMGFMEPTAEYVRDFAYLKLGDQLVALRKGGEVAVVLEKIVDGSSIFKRGYIGLNEGSLTLWYLDSYGRNNKMPVVLAEGVLELDCSTLLLFTKADGCYMIAYDDDYEETVVYLGEEPMKYYIDYFERMQSSWAMAS